MIRVLHQYACECVCSFLILVLFAEEKVPADEAAEVRLHLPHAPLREPHGARDGSGQRQADPAGGAPARVRAVARFRAHHPGLGHPVQRARSPTQDQEEGEFIWRYFQWDFFVSS